MATKDLYSANNFHRMSFGDFGMRTLIKNTDDIVTAPGEYFCMIECIISCTFDATNYTPAGDNNMVDYYLLDGQIIYGNFTNITLTKGHIIAYLRHVPQ